MSLGNFVEKTLTALGEKNKATYAVVAIAIVKGICRPLFTMMDKNEDPETKKYTAIREGLTEAIAIPVYLASGNLMEKFANKLAVPKNFMEKQLHKRHLAGDTAPEVLKAFDTAKELAEDNLPKMKGALNFLGVCTAALLIIPALCSVAIKPIMNGIKKISEKKALEDKLEEHEEMIEDMLEDLAEGKKIDINTAQPIVLTTLANFPINNDSYKRLHSFSNVHSAGMKVGAV